MLLFDGFVVSLAVIFEHADVLTEENIFSLLEVNFQDLIEGGFSIVGHHNLVGKFLLE
jgi:hypothetical protein